MGLSRLSFLKLGELVRESKIFYCSRPINFSGIDTRLSSTIYQKRAHKTKPYYFTFRIMENKRGEPLMFRQK